MSEIPPQLHPERIYTDKDVVILPTPYSFSFKDIPLETHAALPIHLNGNQHLLPLLQIGDDIIAFLDLHPDRNPLLAADAAQELAATISQQRISLIVTLTSSKSQQTIARAVDLCPHGPTLIILAGAHPHTPLDPNIYPHSLTYYPITTPTGKIVAATNHELQTIRVALNKGSTVAIADDVCSTGASTKAAKELLALPPDTPIITTAREALLANIHKPADNPHLITPRALPVLPDSTQIGPHPLSDCVPHIN